jgi:hypothetical protein
MMYVLRTRRIYLAQGDLPPLQLVDLGTMLE